VNDARAVLQRSAPSLLLAASGFASLAYQIVWTQQCSSWLGHESAAVLAVVAAFFGGMAAGGLALGKRIEQSSHPVRWYAGCELAIGLWSLLLFPLLPFVSTWLAKAVGVEASPLRQWVVAFAGTFALLLPATAAMGATVPAMERLVEPLRERGRSIAALYAVNTFGAVAGVLASAFWSIPKLGLARSAGFAIVLNALCAVLALAFLGEPTLRARPAATNRDRARFVLVRLAATGFLGIGYEVVVVRTLSQVTEDTVYTFALLLAVYLLGTAAGALMYRRWLESGRLHERLGDHLLAALAVACLLGGGSLWLLEGLKYIALNALGASAGAALAAEGMLAVAAFGAPTVVMGALFSHLARSANAAGVGFGHALGFNTLAAAPAPVIFGVLVVPTLGTKFTLLTLVAGYLVLTTRSLWLTKLVALPAVMTLAVAVLAPPLVFVQVPEGGRLVSHAEGALAAVSVSEDADGVRRLRINNRQQEGTNETLQVDARQAWLPLLLHPAPRRALFLGLGTGVTATSAATDAELEVTAVELLPEVIAASPAFTEQRFDEPTRRRLHLVAADARRFVRASDRHYDVIVSDNFHPARGGSGALYTVEHFRSVRERLEQGGLFCQWLPLHQLDLGTLRSIVRSFTTAFPGALAVLASNSLETPVIGLVARREEERFTFAAVRARLSALQPPEWWPKLGLNDEYALLGSFIAGPRTLVRFAASAAANTDDRPIVAYSAPRITYAPESSPRERLFSLLAELAVTPDEVLAPAGEASDARRLSAYFVARNRFLAAGRGVHVSRHVEDMLAQVREPLLSVLRTSPDFRPAYDPLLSMASALARSNAAAARALLVELARLQPARTEASQVLRSIDNISARVAGAER
jgi:spermidine synthase